MSEFEELTKFSDISIDRGGFVRMTSIQYICGKICKEECSPQWVFIPLSRYVFRANELICIATWLNQLNGVNFDVSMLA